MYLFSGKVVVFYLFPSACFFCCLKCFIFILLMGMAAVINIIHIFPLEIFILAWPARLLTFMLALFDGGFSYIAWWSSPFPLFFFLLIGGVFLYFWCLYQGKVRKVRRIRIEVIIYPTGLKYPARNKGKNRDQVHFLV